MEFKLPTEIVELPSKGKLYPEDHPLRSGTIEMRYMTAKEEDILSNQSYIKNGTVLDKLLQSLIVTKFNYDDILIGDKNALMIAARILGYGKDYNFKYKGEEQTVDLSTLDAKPLSPALENCTSNEFPFTLPTSGVTVTFKILSSKDEKEISEELESYKKINSTSTPEISTRLKHLILSVNEERDKKRIREFVDNFLLASDARALRKYILEISPDVDLTFFPEPNGERVDLPIGLGFFWPDF